MNPRRPTPTGLEPAPFDLARAPPLHQYRWASEALNARVLRLLNPRYTSIWWAGMSVALTGEYYTGLEDSSAHESIQSN